MTISYTPEIAFGQANPHTASQGVMVLSSAELQAVRLWFGIHTIA
jgi:hypothetical protein